jgi:hypothetical protein
MIGAVTVELDLPAFAYLAITDYTYTALLR